MDLRLPIHIAWRYLKGKKTYNAIQVVSGVSAAAVAVVTAAMVCVLSVMNGFGVVVESMFSRFDPDLKVIPTVGKSFVVDSTKLVALQSLPGIVCYSEVIEETALVEYSDKQLPALLKGVDDHYQEMTQIDSILVEGQFSTYDGAFERTVMGQGLAAQLGVGAYFVKGLHIYAPRRNHKVNLMRPDESFTQEVCFMAGTFAVNQVKYDDQLMLVSLPMAQRLFDYSPHQVTALEIKVADDASVKKVKKDVISLLGNQYEVLDRYEQQQDFFRILKIEKWLTALLMVFILLIASFNLTGSLTMLILDKRNDIHTFHHLGASPRQIRQIFLFEGWLISSIGALCGVVLGVALCLLQEHFGWVRLGNGTDYILSAYPVALMWEDVAGVLLVVLAIGFMAAWYPTHRLNPNNSSQL